MAIRVRFLEAHCRCFQVRHSTVLIKATYAHTRTYGLTSKEEEGKRQCFEWIPVKASVMEFLAVGNKY